MSVVAAASAFAGGDGRQRPPQRQPGAQLPRKPGARSSLQAQLLQQQQPQQQQQQQQQQWPAALLRPPPDGSAAVVDVSQQQTWEGQRPPHVKGMLPLLPAYADIQQLLWVSVHQPGGPGSPAAVWLGSVSEHDAQGAQLLQGSGDRLLIGVPRRPPLGCEPTAVVTGLTFLPCGGGGDDGGGNGMAPAAPGGAAWRDYLLLCQGDFSAVEHDNMFPNALVHCGTGCTTHNARGAADAAELVAEPEEGAVREHAVALIRWAWGTHDPRDGRKPLDEAWVMQRLKERWGAEAMARFGVDYRYFAERFREAGVANVPLPSHAAAAAAAPNASSRSSGGGGR